MPSVTMTLPKLHNMQLDILKNAARFRVVFVGRQAGKTLLLSTLMAIHFMTTDSANILYGTPSYQQTRAMERYLRRWFNPLSKIGVIEYKRGTMDFVMGERTLSLRTASEPDRLRSEAPSFVALDEAAYLKPETFDEVVLPMIETRAAPVVMASTPSAGSWLNQLYLKHQQSPRPDWAWWNMPSTVNPHLPASATDTWRENMTDAAFREEILAEVLAGEGGVFTRINEAATLDRAQPVDGGRYVFGIDWGEQHDYTVIVVMDANTRQMVDMARFNRIGWDGQRQRIIELYNQWRPVTVISEASSGGVVLNEQLAQAGMPVQPFQTTASTKPQIINSLALAFDKRELQVLNDPVLVSELMMFQAFRGTSGYVQYRAPSGGHDDCVMALAFAWHGVVNYGQSISIRFINL